MYEVYYMARPIYLETDSSGIGLGAGLLQAMDGMNWGIKEVMDNAILHLIAFATQNLSSTEQHYNNIECEALGNQMG